MKTSIFAPYCWYAIRTTFNRELKLQRFLENEGVKSFIPMQYQSVVKDEVKRYVEKPAIHNLVFVYSTKEIIDKLIEQTDIYFQYIRACETQRPAIISDEEMEGFIRITEMTKEGALYLKDDFEKFKKYSRVRVTGGRFAGLEGYFVRVKRDRKVVVMIQNITAIAISGIDHSLIEVIDIDNK